MKLKPRSLRLYLPLAFVASIAAFLTMRSLPPSTASAEDGLDHGETFVTIYDEGTKTTVKTSPATVREVLAASKVAIDEHADIIEPSLDAQISGPSFYVNIYRARPALITDGPRTTKLMTASTVPRDVATAASIDLFPEDVVKITTEGNFLAAGIPFAYEVVRARRLTFDFYGSPVEARTQATTIAAFLTERGITLTEDDWLSLPGDTPVTDDLTFALSRNGKSTIVVEESIPQGESLTYDFSRPVGYRETTHPGIPGQKSVTYEIEMLAGQEISRTKISEITTSSPTPATVVLGTKALSMNPLTKSMGRNHYTTSTGIAREETYYDLPMTRVMRNCGAAGHYKVRIDGVKVDSEGYVIIAADLGRYPRCSLVETSLGPGKVYDTGSFATSNPEQFDIATDWTKPGNEPSECYD